MKRRKFLVSAIFVVIGKGVAKAAPQPKTKREQLILEHLVRHGTNSQTRNS